MNLKNIIVSLWSKLHPRSRVEYLYKKEFGRPIDWKAPKEMNEKIRWMQFNTDTSLWSILADKHEVTRFLRNKGYDNILIKQYGVWDNPKDIEFDKLPNKFVLKTTHGAGSVYIIKDKSLINIESLCRRLSKDLRFKYGIESYEKHYLDIKPRIIAEEILDVDNDISSSLIDYKFYVANGVPICCGVMFNRNIKKHMYDVSMYDLEWCKHDDWLKCKANSNDIILPKPKNWQYMLELCKDLCEDFPFVRLDLYESNGKVYFGEFTFTPSGLNGGSLSKSMCDYIGKCIIL